MIAKRAEEDVATRRTAEDNAAISELLGDDNGGLEGSFTYT